MSKALFSQIENQTEKNLGVKIRLTAKSNTRLSEQMEVSVYYLGIILKKYIRKICNTKDCTRSSTFVNTAPFIDLRNNNKFLIAKHDVENPAITNTSPISIWTPPYLDMIYLKGFT